MDSALQSAIANRKSPMHLVLLAGLWLLAGLSLAGTAGPPELEAVNQKLRAGLPVTIAALGDSITFVCFHTDARQNYVTFVVDALRQAYLGAQIKTVIAGNSHGLADRLIRLQQEVLASRADVVFIMFGMNDCVGGDKNLDVYDSSLTEMIRRARAGGALPVIATQNEIMYDSPGGDRRRALPAYMARAAAVASREKCLLVDNFADWQALQAAEGPRWTEYLDDAIHPNLAGHRRFARHTLETLWPEAAPLQYAGLRPPLPQSKIKPVPCLLGGPPDKQILRVTPRTWLALTAGRRGAEVTDLILWIAEDVANPTWKDFRPITLTGPGREALFDWGERSISSAALLIGQGRLFIAFTPTVRMNLLSAENPQGNWYQTLSRKQSYTSFLLPSSPIPQDAHGSYQADCEILDAFPDAHGYPAYLLRDLLLNVGAGVVYQAFGEGTPNGTDKTGNYTTRLLFKDYTGAQGGVDESNQLYVVGQAPGSRALTLSYGKQPCLALDEARAERYSFSVVGNVPVLLADGTKRGSFWRAARLVNGQWENLKLPSSTQWAGSLAVIAAGGRPHMLAVAGREVSVYSLEGGSFRRRTKSREPSRPGAIRYEGRIPAGASNLGLLWEGEGLNFTTVPISREN
jgi:lysophospholipase L1-like esterase